MFTLHEVTVETVIKALQFHIIGCKEPFTSIMRDPSLRIHAASGRITELNRVKACAPLQLSKSCFNHRVFSEKDLLKHAKNTVLLVCGLINSNKNTSILFRDSKQHLEVFDK